MIETLKKFISIKTIANDEKSNNQGIELVSNLLKSIGFTISIEGNSSYKQPVIIAKYKNKNSTKKVTLYSHYDVEKIHREAKWNTKPFDLTEKDGRYYARGIADNKGILLSRIFSLIELKNNNEELPNILWIIQGEEEVAGKTPFEVIPKHIKEFKSKIYVEETGIYKKETPIIFHLPITNSTPLLIDDLNKVIYDGKAIYANRHLNKFTKCPFVTNIPKDAYYIGFGPNDSASNIHRDNESLNIDNLVKHNDVFKKFIKWVNKTEV
ncbi:M20/M25/M40 family metallo-hydrolase [Tenacibaculum dicentrarchi]|nr:M20/M25/M40 family metallo-hydrolase [Tenacibaculum dicentrarchi]